jgi:hypothetical protein
MKEFTVYITETLTKEIQVKGEDLNEVYNEITKEYEQGEIILDSSDFVGYEIEVEEN